MTRTTVERTIDAPVEMVFETVAHIDNFSKAIPRIVNVEFLSTVKSGVGARFRETRDMRGRHAVTELEVTEYVDNDRVRLVADAGGTTWDTVFTVTPTNDRTRLTMVMDATAHNLLAKLLNPLLKGMIKKEIEKDMDSVKAYCEGKTG